MRVKPCIDVGLTKQHTATDGETARAPTAGSHVVDRAWCGAQELRQFFNSQQLVSHGNSNQLVVEPDEWALVQDSWSKQSQYTAVCSVVFFCISRPSVKNGSSRMPQHRSAPNRNIELTVARHVTTQRQLREWTLQELAARMKAAGCDIASTSIMRLEKEPDSRRVTVSELLAYARVFGMSTEALLSTPPDRWENRGVQLLHRYVDAADAAEAARLAADDAASAARSRESELRDFVREGRHLDAASIRQILRAWSAQTGMELSPIVIKAFDKFAEGFGHNSPLGEQITGEREAQQENGWEGFNL